MKYLLIPVNSKSSSDTNADVMLPGFVMQLLTGIFGSIFLTGTLLPDVHGWGRFAICLMAIAILLLLSLAPVIGPFLCVANAILWIILFWFLVGGIPIEWLKWTLRIITTLLILLFEGGLSTYSISI
jgi:hypothetical protein